MLFISELVMDKDILHALYTDDNLLLDEQVNAKEELTCQELYGLLMLAIRHEAVRCARTICARAALTSDQLYTALTEALYARSWNIANIIDAQYFRMTRANYNK